MERVLPVFLSQPPPWQQELLRHSSWPSALSSCSAFRTDPWALLNGTLWSVRQSCSGNDCNFSWPPPFAGSSHYVWHLLCSSQSTLPDSYSSYLLFWCTDQSDIHMYRIGVICWVLHFSLLAFQKERSVEISHSAMLLMSPFQNIYQFKWQRIQDGSYEISPWDGRKFWLTFQWTHKKINE